MREIINILGKRKSQVLSRFNETRIPCVILEGINKEIEDKIDVIVKYGGAVKLPTGVTVTKNDIYVYGDINLDSKADIQYLSKFQKIILNPYTMNTFIPTSFNYKTNTYILEDGVAVGSPFQSSYLKWFKYNYCLIGKPKKIIIYHYPNRR